MSPAVVLIATFTLLVSVGIVLLLVDCSAGLVPAGSLVADPAWHELMQIMSDASKNRAFLIAYGIAVVMSL